MRLINCSTLQLEEFFGRKIPPYAILSHTWGDEEISFADLPFSPSTTARAGYRKIAFTCAQAIKDGLKYAWIDTCCIDKSSSSELSEAINSMFAWYRDSACSYAYLSDVLKANMSESFPKSRWFTRGWTLQELLAPEDVTFYDQQWNDMGTKSEHAEWISEIAGIDAEALLSKYSGEVASSYFCVAKKMSWASHRETTRPEDIAYCLLGILDVNMPLLYGEGNRAFLRLQEEIIRGSDDDSILAWGLEPEMEHPLGLVPNTVKKEMAEWFTESDLLASSPKDFMNCANLKYTPGTTSPFTLTNVGLQIKLPLIPVYQPDEVVTSTMGGGWIGLLSCSSGTGQEFLGIPLIPSGNDDGPTVQQVSRIHVGAPKRKELAVTLLVGPRAAVRSVPSTTIISRYGSISWVGEHYNGHQQIIINESKNLQDIGYRVRNGTRSIILNRNGGAGGYDSIWNPETLILTMDDRHTYGQLVEFCFEQPQNEQATKFTIFMHTSRGGATVREGDYFSRDDKLALYGYLKYQSTQGDVNSIEIPGSEGKVFNVSARIRNTEVYRRQLFEVNVEAVQV